MNDIQIYDLHFQPYISQAEIDQCCQDLASRINRDYAGQEILFIGILNGAFMFAANLIQRITVDCHISFVKASSYSGTESTSSVCDVIGLTEDLRDKHVIVLEDIVDTGITIDHLYHNFSQRKPASLEICTFLFKPDKYVKDIPLKYIGRSIPNAFVVGYGFDYNGRGRNLPLIYQLKED